MPRRNILALLQGRDRRSIGRSNQVAAAVSKNSTLFPDLISGLWHEDPLVRMRAADAAEKVTRKSRELLQPYKKELLALLNDAEEPELRWHLAVMIPRLELDGGEKKLVASVLERYLDDSSSIVKTFALQGMTDLAQSDQDIRQQAIQFLRLAARNGTPAMKARSRRLLGRLETL